MRTQKDQKLSDVIEKYKRHPQFIGIEISDPNQPGALDDTMLHFAARRGAIEDIEILVAAGAQTIAIGDLGYTALHEAAMAGRLEAVRKLLELGGDPRIANEFGESVSKVAQNAGHDEIVRVLENCKLPETAKHDTGRGET